MTDLVNKIHEVGLRCSIDDFGSGYSSLNMLKDIKIDALKLDRVFFAGLTKKGLRRGEWRYLTEQEVNFLRMGSFE